MNEPAFTVLMPVNRPPDLMRFAIASVLAQTRPDFELFIICDGAPAETVAEAYAAADRDPRIHVFPFAKGERHGEAHRHVALNQARGDYVCQIADDDQWFPEHLAEMAKLLADVEFGNLLHTAVDSDDCIYVRMEDLTDVAVSSRMLNEEYNFFGPTVSGYRLDCYRGLPQGWSPAPAGLWTDLAMWRKFLTKPGIVLGTRLVITSLHFPNFVRIDWPPERRRAEAAFYAALINTEHGRDNVRQRALLNLARAHVNRDVKLAEMGKHLAGLDRALTISREELKNSESTQAEAQKRIASQSRDLEELTYRLARSENKLSALEASASFRLTAPLRKLYTLAAKWRRNRRVGNRECR